MVEAAQKFTVYREQDLPGNDEVSMTFLHGRPNDAILELVKHIMNARNFQTASIAKDHHRGIYLKNQGLPATNLKRDHTVDSIAKARVMGSAAGDVTELQPLVASSGWVKYNGFDLPGGDIISLLFPENFDLTPDEYDKVLRVAELSSCNGVVFVRQGDFKGFHFKTTSQAAARSSRRRRSNMELWVKG